MQAPLLHKVHNQSLWLSPFRTVFWEEQKTLILSDLHFGKTGHFRKAGVAVPQTVFKEDLQRLVNLLQYFQPKQIVAVGDLFHSHANLELELFKRWRLDFAVDFFLVKGNHDILPANWYQEAEIRVSDDSLMLGDFCFTHQYCATGQAAFTFCGHIHPGVVITGLGKQSLRFPCFYFARDHSILPAFSKFTGLATLRPGKEDAVFAIVENSLIKLQ